MSQISNKIKQISQSDVKYTQNILLNGVGRGIRGAKAAVESGGNRRGYRRQDRRRGVWKD